MKTRKKTLQKVVGKANLEKLPIYYNIMNERPPQTESMVAFSKSHEGSFFISALYYKPISRILN